MGIISSQENPSIIVGMNSLKIKVANSARQFESTLNLAFTVVFRLEGCQ